MGIAPTTGTYLISSAVGGVDDASYPGIFALVGDFFNPKNRGKILGLLFVSQPLVTMVGFVLNQSIFGGVVQRQWLFFFSITALIFAVLIFSFMREPRRGGREPALANSKLRGFYVWDWVQAKYHLRQPVMLMFFGAGFFNRMPWAVLTAYSFIFLKNTFTMTNSDIYITISSAMAALIVGYILGGYLGDILFQKVMNGRIIPNLFGSALSGIFLVLTLRGVGGASSVSLLWLTLMGFSMGHIRPNLAASIQDVTIPELRSTTFGFFLFFESLGELGGVLLVLLLQKWLTLGEILLLVCISAWAIFIIFQVVLLKLLPDGIETLRQHMAYRSYLESRMEKLALMTNRRNN